MILNSKNNNFVIRYPKNFFNPKIVKRYESYLKRLPIPYESLEDYMSASIQAITFPAISPETVEQILYEDRVSAKGGKRLHNYFDRNITITMKLYEGYINYWVMFDLLCEYWALDTKDKYLPDLTLSFMDHTGFEFVAVNFKQIIYKSLSEVELNYSSNTAEFKNFTVGFEYNYMKVLNRKQ